MQQYIHTHAANKQTHAATHTHMQHIQQLQLLWPQLQHNAAMLHAALKSTPDALKAAPAANH